MLVHTAQVRGRKIAWDKREVVQHGLNADRIKFDLDAEFRCCDSYQVVLCGPSLESPKRYIPDKDMTVAVPPSLMESTGPVSTCLLGYVGGEVRIVTAQERYPLVVVESGFTGPLDPGEEQPDLWAQIMSAEAARIEAELVREAAETARADAEAKRIAAEKARETASAEAVKAANEASAKAEQAARRAEDRVTAALAEVAEAEQARTEAEEGRAAAESSRAEAEAARIAAESKRESAEAKRKADSAKAVADASAATSAANAAAGKADAAAQTATDGEASRVAAETARANAEQARAIAETGRVEAEATRAAHESERTESFNTNLVSWNTKVDDAVRRADDAADAVSKYLEGKVTGVNVTADDNYGGRPLGVVINGNSVSNLVGEPTRLSSNGITLTKNDNGSYHVSGTSTAEAVFYFRLELGGLKVGDKFSMLVDSDMSGIGDININAYKSSGDWNETLYAYSQAHTLSYTFGPSNGESVRANMAIVINEGESLDTDIAITIVEGDIVPDRQYPSGVTKAEPTALLIGPLGHPERVELPSGLTLDEGDYVSIESDGKVTATVSGGASVIGTVELPDLPRGSFEASAESNIQVAVDVIYIRDMYNVVLQAAGLQRLWSGKKVVLIGTSVGFGSNAETNYITEASKCLGFSFVNASVPGQAIHTQADGRPMTYGSTVLSVAEYEGFGTTIPDAPLPDDPGGSYNSFYRTWENIFSDANKDADIWLYAVAPNNTNFATSDWDAFDKSSWRYSDGSPFDEHRATFIGALLFLMDKMYELNPEARMAFVLDSAFAYGPNEARGNIETVAGFWHIPVIDLYGSANTSPKSLVKLQSKEGTDKHPSTFGQRLFGRMLAGRLPQFA